MNFSIMESSSQKLERRYDPIIANNELDKKKEVRSSKIRIFDRH